MTNSLHAVALDYDGTVTRGPRPGLEVLDALARARRDRALVLVTGRILSELRADFREVDEYFDLIVAENGGVLCRDGMLRELAPPVDPRLRQALAARGVPVRSGRVLLACDATHLTPVVEEMSRLGLDCQLVYNRTALMILPAGVTKGSGLSAGLAELGIPQHNTLAVGDAENDRSLFDVCEVGVAVANAVGDLKEHADLVLDQPDGAGVAALLDGPVLAGHRRVHSQRWQVELGVEPGGSPVRIPANQVNVLIIGASGSGKSYAAGLFAEQVLALGYTALVLDASGEHRALTEGGDTLTLQGAEQALPPPDQVGELLGRYRASLDLDLSLLPDSARKDYVEEVPPAVATHRAQTGLPHWVVIEEAHLLAGGEDVVWPLLQQRAPSHCLVTFHPRELSSWTTSAVDVVIAAAGEGAGRDQTVAYLAGFTGRPEDEIDKALAATPAGEALVTYRDSPGELVPVTLGARQVTHVRHRRKYAEAELPEQRRFYFSSGDGAPGPVAGNVGQLHDLLAVCDERYLAFHLPRGDFSRWIREVLGDRQLAESVAAIERTHGSDQDWHAARGRLVDTVAARYL